MISTTTSQPTQVTSRIDLESLSLRDALDLAILIEDEARERYEQFSQLGGRYAGDAGDVFRMMAGAEAKHGKELSDRRRKLFGDEPSRVNRDMLDDVEAPDRGKPRVYMSPRDALEVALASEQKAHDFFAALVPRVKDPDVKKLFQELQQEEVEHQGFIRARLEKLPPGPDVEEDEADEPGMDPGN